jgi:membrane protein
MRREKGGGRAPKQGLRWTAFAFAAGIALALCANAADEAIRQRPSVPEASAADGRDVPILGRWRRALFRAWTAFNQDQIPAAAAGVTFFVLLALFPALSACASLFGLFGDPSAMRALLVSWQNLLPSGALQVMGDQLQRLQALPQGGLSVALATSLLISVWSANAGVKALMAALNTAYERREQRGFWQLNLVSLGFTVAAVAATVVLGALLASPLTSGASFAGPLMATALRFMGLLLCLVAGLAALYRFGPCRRPAPWRVVLPGAAVAILGWVCMSFAFTWYVGHFGSYNRTYGALGAIVGFMTWIWLSCTVVLFGAELNDALEDKPARSAAERSASAKETAATRERIAEAHTHHR